ncbi:MAG: hypothetical protein SV375_05210 [Thermodesulfobacteriota bacterium]|nr:hypothetical protein [Thermodesulfobacteriota bacterium]
MEKYPQTCSWCEKEGIVTIVGYTSIEGSNRICDRHAREMEEQVAAIMAQRRSVGIQGELSL